MTNIKRWIPNPIKEAIKSLFIGLAQWFFIRLEQQRYLSKQVRYVSQQPQNYIEKIGLVTHDLNGKSILMIGPGCDLYSSIVFAGYGAKVYVAEKYPVVWDQQFHPKFYRRLQRAMQRDFPTADRAGLQSVIATSQHDTIPTMEILPCGLEEISALADDSIDMSLSNAVFEHLYDVKKSIEELFRVTRPGGMGWHHIDFRWHRDFENPLEYCTLTEEAFLAIAAACHYECGNRLRYAEFQTFFEQAGFIVDSFEGNVFAKPGYIEAIHPKLQPRYQDMPIDQLRTLSGLFVVRKPA